MAFQTSSSTSPNIRHRIQEITLQPTISERPIGIEVLADGQTVHKLSTIKPGQTLRWDLQTYPCDAHLGSTIGLRLIETHYVSRDREVLVEYTLSEAAGQTSVIKHPGAFPSGLSAFGLGSKKPNTASAAKPLTVTVKLVDTNQIAASYPNTFARATKMAEETQGPLDKLGNSREVLKTIIGFGAVVAELHPTAKLVMGLCTKAWEHLEKIQKQHEDLQRLIDGMAEMRPFIDSVKNHVKEAALENVILALLRLIEDTSNYIINSMNRTGTGRVIDGINNTRDSDRVKELLQKFGDLKELFDRGVDVQVLGVSAQALDVGVQVLNQVLSSEQRALINQLKPAVPSLNTMPSPCHEGTRTEVIADIRAWYNDTNSPQKLLWLYGQAGMGKSSIAASVCQVFHDAGTLGAHFFFRRDDPYLRSPEHMLNVIVHRLAFQYEPYGRAVASAIEGYSGLLDMPLGQRYVHLVEHPLKSLELSAGSPTVTFIIVIDALDECEKTDSRRPLFIYLQKMSQLAPWVKIVITSRPDEDIEAAFNNTDYSHVMSRSIASFDASSDILKYAQMRMDGIANRKKRPSWPQDSINELSKRAAGLFIWVETACKFIERGADMRARLEQVLAGTQSTEGSAPLDLLYATAIKQGMGDEGPDNVRVFRECIGAIVATGSRAPLSVIGLESLLSGHVSTGVFEIVVRALGSVLYEDASQRGAVRVYHPSFADFILDPSRSGNFYTDPLEQSTVLADYSLRTMMRELRFNICGLETSHILNCDVVDLESRVQTVIGPHLAYSCLHWSSHLTETPKGTLQNQLGEFLYERQLVYWIEAMSLLEQTNTALSSLLDLISWASDTMNDLSSYANDAYRFILMFYDAISQSTPHLYISALPFAPAQSKLAHRMRPYFPNAFMTAVGTNEGWPNWLQSMPHNGMVMSVACSANERRIVSGCWDDTVRIWDSETGAAISEPLSSPGVRRVAISSDGQRIASSSELGTLRVWDARTGAQIGDSFLSDNNYSAHLALSSDGSRLFYVNADGIMLVWNIDTRAQLCELLLAHGDYISTAAVSLDEPSVLSDPDDVTFITSAAVSPNEKIVASISSYRTIIVWDIKTGNLLTDLLVADSDMVYCVAFSPDSRFLATGSNNGTVQLWEVSTGRTLGQPISSHSSDVLSVAFSADGRHVVSGSRDRTVRVWDVETSIPVSNALLGHKRWITSVAFCSNNQRVASASADGMVLIWDVQTDVAGSKPTVGHAHAVESVAISSDGHYLASASWDGTIRVWDAQNGDEAFAPLTGHLDAVQLVAFIPNSRRILFLAGHKTVQIHDMDTSAPSVSFVLSSSNDIISVTLSPNGQRLAAGSEEGQLEVWDAETGAIVFAPIAAHPSPVRAVAFSPDGRFVVSGSYDRTMRIWEAETGAAVGEPFTGHSGSVLAVCFSPDSRRIVTGLDDGSMQVWDVESGVTVFASLRGHEKWVHSIAFTPDGRYIISGSGDTTLRIWNAETGFAVAEPLQGHSASVFSIAVSPDGRRIATGSEDCTVRIWDMENLRSHDQLLIEELFTAPLKRSASTSVLAHYANKAGWVISNNNALLTWLPKKYQRADDSLIQISIEPALHMLLDFSRFVHGNSWASVAIR